MQLLRFEDSTRQADNGQLRQTESEDGWGRQHVVPKTCAGLFGDCQCSPVSSSLGGCVQVYHKGGSQPEIDLGTRRSVWCCESLNVW